MAVVSIKRAGGQSEQRRENMEAYVEWLLTPRSERVLKTKAAFAESLGVTTQSLRNYARDQWVQSEMAKRGKALNKVERAGDVVTSLYRIALDDGENASARVSAAKAFLDWTDRTVADITVADLNDLSFDDMRRLLDEMEQAVLQ